jgi:hypothetical protein
MGLLKPLGDKVLGKIVSEPLGHPPAEWRDGPTRGTATREGRGGAPGPPRADTKVDFSQPAERLPPRALVRCHFGRRFGFAQQLAGEPQYLGRLGIFWAGSPGPENRLDTQIVPLRDDAAKVVADDLG